MRYVKKGKRTKMQYIVENHIVGFIALMLRKKGN